MVIKEFHCFNSNTLQLAIKIQKLSMDNTPCSCPICLQIPLPSPSPLFQMLECKELQKQYNKYDSSYFEFSPVE